MNLTAESIVAISAAVVALVQLVKWAGLPDRRGPLVVLAFAFVGVMLYQVSYAPEGRIVLRTDIWPIFAAWIAVALSAAGVFGFTRAASDAVTATKSPPPGAGASPTVKEGP
jgi:hypothetical protein